MESKNNSGGIGFCGLLQVSFIVLKLIKAINWKWIFVFMPSIVYFIALCICVGFLYYIENKEK